MVIHLMINLHIVALWAQQFSVLEPSRFSASSCFGGSIPIAKACLATFKKLTTTSSATAAATSAAGRAAHPGTDEHIRWRDPASPSPVLTDLTRPADWYPLARSMKRRVIAHLGPTNSGKTHAALQALKSAPSGVYCGPLRLLACEVADRLVAEGIPCKLVTGQEVRHPTGPSSSLSNPHEDPENPNHQPLPARHIACTIEMAEVSSTRGLPAHSPGGGGGSLGAPLAVAVLDEIQMLGDLSRGWAWTRALLGLAAAEVHVAGDPGVLPVLRALVVECGEELEVIRYRRLSPLVVAGEPLGTLSGVRGGDCVVGFSRRGLHGLRREVVRRTGRDTCLVYGALPPDTRRQQAALFNGHSDPVSGAAAAAAGDESSCSSTDSSSGRNNGSGTSSGYNSNGGDGGDADSTTDTSAGHHRAGYTHRPRPPHPAGAASSRSDGGDGSDVRDGDGGGEGGGAGARVLVASDAIGMGLNLKIRRVVFTSLHKYDGKAVRPLAASEVRQIAGRAGRFSSLPSAVPGTVTALRACDLPALHAALREPPQPVTRACLLPRTEDLAAFAARHPDRPLATSLLMFAAAARLAPAYVYGQYDGMYRIASALRHLEGRLGVEEVLLFATAPADMDDPAVSAALLRFAELYCQEGRVGSEAITSGRLPSHPPATESELKHLEELHGVYDLYVWLSYRLPYAFTGREAAEVERAACGELIEAGLEALAAAAFGRRHPHPHPHTHIHS